MIIIMMMIFWCPPQAPGALHTVRVLCVRCAGAEHRPSDSSRVVCLRLAAPYLPSPPHRLIISSSVLVRLPGVTRVPWVSCSPPCPEPLGFPLYPCPATWSVRLRFPGSSIQISPRPPDLSSSHPARCSWPHETSFVELWFSFLYQILTYFPVSQFSSGQFSTFLKCLSSLMFGLYPCCSSCTSGPETRIRMWSHKENVVLSKSRKDNILI